MNQDKKEKIVLTCRGRKEDGEQLVRNMHGGLHFLGLKAELCLAKGISSRNLIIPLTEEVQISDKTFFSVTVEMPSDRLKKFVWLICRCHHFVPGECLITDVRRASGGPDLRASTPEEEARADYLQKMRTPTAAEDAGLTINF